MARKMYYEDNYKKNGQVEVSSLKYLFPHKYYTLQYCWICVVADADQVDGTGITYVPHLINSIRCLVLRNSTLGSFLFGKSPISW